MGQGRYPYFLGRIRPFFNSDTQIPVLFYSVPEGNASCYPTVFTDRFWDDREHWTNLGVGTVSGSLKVFEGRGMQLPSGQPVGTPDQFIAGLDFNVWQAGGYPVPHICYPLTLTTACICFGLSAKYSSTAKVSATACVCFGLSAKAYFGLLTSATACVCFGLTATSRAGQPASATACVCFGLTASSRSGQRTSATSCICFGLTATSKPATAASATSCVCFRLTATSKTSPATSATSCVCFRLTATSTHSPTTSAIVCVCFGLFAH